MQNINIFVFFYPYIYISNYFHIYISFHASLIYIYLFRGFRTTTTLYIENSSFTLLKYNVRQYYNGI